jgi:hypothetical protein
VLEVDPDNALARRQVGQVATAVRQFDRTAPGRRWLGGMRGGLFADNNRWMLAARVLFCTALVFIIAFSIGYVVGGSSAVEDVPQKDSPAAMEKSTEPSNRLGP